MVRSCGELRPHSFVTIRLRERVCPRCYLETKKLEVVKEGLRVAKERLMRTSDS
jgi:NMD protein affecting ribosome stability and mRNA decay